MPSDDPSLISGLDPVALFGLSAEEPSAHGTWEPPSLDEVARLFPKWKVLGLLGRGGMGAVYHLHQPDLDREVAVKLLPIESCNDERQVARFQREARTLAKLKHPGIVALHEAGITPAGHFFFVMEHVDGQPLSALIARGRISVASAIEIVREVCDALAYAHGQGVVHRDIKPSNILIDAAGHAKVADFGLAHLDQTETEGALSLSRTGMFVGTAAYTAPEQARDSTRVDHRADLYSLGVLLYEMLTGDLPRGTFQPPSRKVGSDSRLDSVVQKALQERPEDRYQAASDLKNDVSAVQPASKRPASHWLPWSIATLLLLAGAGYFILKKDPLPAQPIADQVIATAPAATMPTKPAIVPQQTLPQPSPPPVPAVEPTPSAPAKPAPEVPMRSPVVIPVPAIVAAAPTAKVWSINPLPPELSPPNEVMKQAWRDCVLTATGGAVLLADGGTVFQWGKGLPVAGAQLPGEPANSLHATATCIVLLRAHDLLFMSDGTDGVPVERPKGLRALFSSAASPWLGITTLDGTALALMLRDGRIERRDLPFKDVQEVAICADGSAYALDGGGRLLRWTGSGEVTRDEAAPKLRHLSAWGQGVLAITEDQQVAGFWIEGSVPALENITEIFTGHDFGMARDAKGKLTLWGSAVPDSPQRMRMPEGTSRLYASPLGVIAAW